MKLVKNHVCSTSDCVNKYIEKGTEANICPNCLKAMEHFIKQHTLTSRERERERAKPRNKP